MEGQEADYNEENDKEIDWGYLRKRARKFNLTEEVEEIYKNFSIT